MIDLKNIIIAVDFDGTCVTHEYPKIGRYIGAEPVLRYIVEAGAKLILFTMRSGKELEDAVNWFKEKDIPLFGINENPEQKSWTTSPKPYAHFYIDDASITAPLCPGLTGERPYIDWEEIESVIFGEKL
jgi:hypothetical protein